MGSTEFSNQGENDNGACSKAIFSHEPGSDWSFKEDGYYLLVNNRFTELRHGQHLVESVPKPIIPPESNRVQRNRRAYKRWQIRQNSYQGIPPKISQNDIKTQPKRGVITGFSRKAGTRMKKRMLSFEHPSELWIDTTYPDDVMMGLSIEEQKDLDNDIFKKWKRKIETKYPDIEGISRREWQTRKSGERKGEETPHRHNLLRIRGLSEKQKKAAVLWVLIAWVNCTGTKEKGKALKVALHQKSYRLIQGARQAQIYVSKYVSKFEEHNEKISRGRFWMKIGNPTLTKPIAIPLTEKEDKLIRRFFRRYVRRNSKISEIIKCGYQAWIEIDTKTVSRMLKWIEGYLTETALGGSPQYSEIPF